MKNSQGHLGGGGGYGTWSIMPVREGQTLLCSVTYFCLLDECDVSKIPEEPVVYAGFEVDSSAPSSGASGGGPYDAVVGDAEMLKEQYPGISWSAMWEELQNLGYSDEEISWAIGG